MSTLIEKEKWTKSTKDYDIGDIVLIVDQILPRERWRICRIEEIKNSADGRQRRYILVDNFKNRFDRHREGIVKIEI